MIDPNLALLEQRQFHKELLAEAEQKRLAEIALSGQPNSDPFYYETLAALGRRLSDLGDRLQVRYGPCECELIPAKESGR